MSIFGDRLQRILTGPTTPGGEQRGRHTICPWKGRAGHYYVVVVGGDRNAAAASHYPHPSPAAVKITGHVRFWRGIRVRPAATA